MERSLETFLSENQNVIGINTFGDNETTTHQSSLQPMPRNKFSIDHANFLIIWRAVLSHSRVLGGENASKPLLFRTNDYDAEGVESIFEAGNASWFAATTDMRLVLGMGKTIPCWDILIDFDNGSSGAQFKQNKHIIQSVTVHFNTATTSTSNNNNNYTGAAGGLSSFTMHLTGHCDSRIRQSIHKGNDTMWTQGIEHSLTQQNITINNAGDSYVERRRQFLKEWWNTVANEIVTIIDMQKKAQADLKNPTVRKQKNNAIKVLLRQHVIDATHIPWLLFICEKMGVDVSGLSAVAKMQLRFGLFKNRLSKKSTGGKVVPINS